MKTADSKPRRARRQGRSIRTLKRQKRERTQERQGPRKEKKYKYNKTGRQQSGKKKATQADSIQDSTRRKGGRRKDAIGGSGVGQGVNPGAQQRSTQPDRRRRSAGHQKEAGSNSHESHTILMYSFQAKRGPEQQVWHRFRGSGAFRPDRSCSPGFQDACRSEAVSRVSCAEYKFRTGLSAGPKERQQPVTDSRTRAGASKTEEHTQSLAFGINFSTVEPAVEQRSGLQNLPVWKILLKSRSCH